MLHRETERLTQYPDAPSQSITIYNYMQNKEKTHDDCYRLMQYEVPNSPVIQFVAGFCFWRHWSEPTGETKFLSVIPSPFAAPPEAFTNIPDHKIAMLKIKDQPSFCIQRISPGSEGNKVINFRVLENVKTSSFQEEIQIIRQNRVKPCS